MIRTGLQRVIQPFINIGDKQVADAVCGLLKGYLNQGDRVLDVGCGSGVVGKAIIKTFDVDLVGIDIEDNRVEKIPFERSDGKNLPFTPHPNAPLVRARVKKSAKRNSPIPRP